MSGTQRLLRGMKSRIGEEDLAQAGQWGGASALKSPRIPLHWMGVAGGHVLSPTAGYMVLVHGSVHEAWTLGTTRGGSWYKARYLVQKVLHGGSLSWIGLWDRTRWLRPPTLSKRQSFMMVLRVSSR